MSGVLIVGAGGHGRSVAEAILLGGGEYRLAGFLDDNWPDPRDVWGYPVFGKFSDLESCLGHTRLVIVAIGNNATRERLQARILAAGGELATIIHPAATVSPRAVLGTGCAVMAGAIVGTEARLGQGVIVNCNATVDHHCTVGDFGHLGVGACMAGGSVLGHGAWMQAGAAIGYGVKVAPGEVLAPGAALPA
ncbi:acetyltransferase [Aromatoleum toluvorans]|uniref:Acetyltransferase n=1 Tax=Aromatoleum toluvorans TaxID=92002 RepID=A0ABX1Q2V1_9RHOO|nr:NeuD/PglB/VioB family sugar acetyltransferase [Aromatoleum toluvorans]NMG46039.1 acetyltransferase [Aromatoleum toluvorans]